MRHRTQRIHKQHSALLLIVVLLVLLVCWWLLSSSFSESFVGGSHAANRIEAQVEQQSHLAFDERYIPPDVLHVLHATHKNVVVYSGTLALPNCDTFATSMSMNVANPAAIALALVVAKGDPACTDVGTSTTPFSVSYAADGHEAVLKNIAINARPVSFSVTESKK